MSEVCQWCGSVHHGPGQICSGFTLVRASEIADLRAKLKDAERENSVIRGEASMGLEQLRNKLKFEEERHNGELWSANVDRSSAERQRDEYKEALEQSELYIEQDLLPKLQAAEAEVARLREAMETDLIYVTSRMDEHPEGYEGACWCRSCCGYATDDGEWK